VFVLFTHSQELLFQCLVWLCDFFSCYSSNSNLIY